MFRFDPEDRSTAIEACTRDCLFWNATAGSCTTGREILELTATEGKNEAPPSRDRRTRITFSAPSFAAR